ncbi:hypothetical protein BRADI_3g06525v3 [Brachypodium distachyon]|uniref:Uncharacterized protein n=1 Tax=Brachypodium distachyon TaxID=15368 RepID=A0A0Q3I027_BRADI|nr:hypothetical protein BRADI_3g06525v3 [Brachypodium distachyon]
MSPNQNISLPASQAVSLPLSLFPFFFNFFISASFLLVSSPPPLSSPEVVQILDVVDGSFLPPSAWVGAGVGDFFRLTRHRWVAADSVIPKAA